MISCFVFNKSDLLRDFMFNMLSSMRAWGYFCFNKNVFNSSSLTSKVFSSDIISFNMRAKLYGMLFRRVLGLT